MLFDSQAHCVTQENRRQAFLAKAEDAEKRATLAHHAAFKNGWRSLAEAYRTLAKRIG